MEKKELYSAERKKQARFWDDFFISVIERKKAHDDYIEKGIIPPPELIRPDIVESWQRSLNSGLDPAHIEPAYVAESVLQEKFVQCEDLLSAADPILEEFADQFSANLFTVDLYDKDLCLIKMYGKPAEPEKWSSSTGP